MKDKNFHEIEIYMDDNLFLQLAKLAHEQDITFNELINKILKEHFDKVERGTN